MRKAAFVVLLGLILVLAACEQVAVPGNVEQKGEPTVKWAGVRFSSYGMRQSFGKDNFPGVSKAAGFAQTMQSYYDGSQGAYILIVGTMSGEDSCSLTFPLSKSIEYAKGTKTDDFYEDYLDAFDAAGYLVWLQVEPGNADLVELAKEVMTRYRHHSCVKGFGIDVEWYRPAGTDGEGSILTATVANKVLKAVRDIDPEYTVFVKHWDYRRLPVATDGFVYVNDSQQFSSLDHVADEFSDWSAHFYPCPVMFQIGYNADRWIWNTFSNPAEEFGQYIVDNMKTGNDVGIIWVDFTLKDVL
ncbi:MAG: hypothetical protein IJ863_05020 [Spirochaetales bacterium]|nr:hypothetical protein [Spirochaetales bacterium]